jgi:nucleotide-binding universal stress UspA family protein
MIADVMVRLDGSVADDVRLAAVDDIAEAFGSHIIALYLNVLPVLVPVEGDPISAVHMAELQQEARAAGDKMEKLLIERLSRLQKPVEIRRFDVFRDAIADIAAGAARAADAFVGLRPNGVPQEPERLVEAVLFGSGRHLFLVPDRKPAKLAFDRVLVAWNGSRESARALAEALPYLHKAETVTVIVAADEDESELQAEMGKDAVAHLKHHGINAVLHHVMNRNDDVGATLIAEAKRRKADLIVMGGYGHSRLREWLLGGATYELMHGSPVPLVVAH